MARRNAGMPALTALVWFGILFVLWLLRDGPDEAHAGTRISV
ncbi:MAG: hypothetical protein NZ524_03480 [Thiobacillaceae bacterium]|nr:hypothetical protein [Thiobacillaceae bacterium]MCX7672127.1 hypothetical protein [Thiobacillaceae bacterium]MDW8324486.1 hypothetical protein [Burkholderiales bacterium]